MKIGVPKEIKTGETRVSMTPSVCRRCLRAGAEVLVESGAGLRAGFSDADYAAAGARLISGPEPVWGEADLIVKVKEPLETEFPLLQGNQTLFTYLHLAAAPALARELLRKRILGIAYETVESADGALPLLKPMSQIAGRLAIQIGAHYLETVNGGSGVLLGGIPGTAAGRVVVLGAGNSGAHACRIAAGMGAQVTVLDLDDRKLCQLDEEYRGAVSTLIASPSNVEHAVAQADLLVGAVLVPGAKAPTVVTRSMVASMRPGSVIVDIAIDQGGCVETIRATSHKAPTYVEEGVLHYAVPNMPALVGRTSTIALTQATEAYVALFAAKGVQAALEEHRGLARGINTRHGELVNSAVAKSLGRLSEG